MRGVGELVDSLRLRAGRDALLEAADGVLAGDGGHWI
jgi:hypothetical protein